MQLTVIIMRYRRIARARSPYFASPVCWCRYHLSPTLHAMASMLRPAQNYGKSVNIFSNIYRRLIKLGLSDWQDQSLAERSNFSNGICSAELAATTSPDFSIRSRDEKSIQSRQPLSPAEYLRRYPIYSGRVPSSHHIGLPQKPDQAMLQKRLTPDEACITAFNSFRK